MDAEKLAAQIEADRQERAVRPDYEAPTCFACGRLSHPKPPSGDDSTRFCSTTCREAFGAGFPPYSKHGKFDPFKVTGWKVIAGGDPGYLVKAPMTMVPAKKCDEHWQGRFRIQCRGCGDQFESLGRAFHSAECRRAYEAGVDAAALMAQVGMDAPTKRMCEARGCSHPIPKWRKGRKVSAKARYCSPKCKQKAWKAGM
jgi:hypothetical protein